jgi:hypothetical protein
LRTEKILIEEEGYWAGSGLGTGLKPWKETLKLKAVLEVPSPLIDSTLVELRPFSFLQKGAAQHDVALSKAFLTRKLHSVLVPLMTLNKFRYLKLSLKSFKLSACVAFAEAIFLFGEYSFARNNAF